MQWFADCFTVVAQCHQRFLTQDDLQKAFGVLFQSCTPPALGFTKLDSTFFALLGGELRHGTGTNIIAQKTKSSDHFLDRPLKGVQRLNETANASLPKSRTEFLRVTRAQIK